MSDRGYSRERDAGRARRRSPISPRVSRSPSPRRYSRSPSHHRARGNSRTRRPSPAASNNNRQPFVAHRENPSPSTVLGVFGLSQYSTERDLKDMFHKFGRIKDIQIVMDKKTNKSRGFGFVYFEDVDSASRAKEALNATELDHHRLRIDFSVTKRAHTPTPGIYMGVRTTSHHRSNGGGGGGGSSSYRRSPSVERKPYHRRHHHHHHRHHHASRSRSRTRSRSRSRRGADRRRRSPGYAHD